MKEIRVVGFLVILLTYFSVSTLLNFNFRSEVFYWLLYVFLVYNLFILNKRLNLKPNLNKTKGFKLTLIFYGVIVTLDFLRGLFFYSIDYWTYKAGIFNFMALTIPLFCYVFANSLFLSNILNFWFKWGTGLIIIFLVFAGLEIENFQWCIAPFLLIGIFIPIVPRFWKVVFSVVLLLSLLTYDARSQMIKAIITIILALLLYFDQISSKNIFRFLFFPLIMTPVLLLLLGISGVFNIFEIDGYLQQKTITTIEKKNEYLSADTRTFIYDETITSAIKNDYVIWGRSLSRGNDSEWFGDTMNAVYKNGLKERNSNEVALTSMFTWTGLIGLIAYSLLFIISSYYAIFKARNKFLPYIGIYVLLYWVYSWVENMILFNLTNLVIWFAIGMCISTDFRSMSNLEFKGWVKSLFINKEYHLIRNY